MVRTVSGDAAGQVTEPLYAMVYNIIAQRCASVQYPAVCLNGTREVLPKHEGTIQDATMVDRFGDPELMASFAAHYVAAYQAVMPNGRLPESVAEMMPALHLLMMAAELVIKADLMRSENDQGNEHSLKRLYAQMEQDHRREAESRFARREPNARLVSVGECAPDIDAVLRVYGESYGGGSKVYLDTRYLAEPTTKLKRSSGLHEANLIKGSTPYPIFLPDVVECLIEAFHFFGGAARLERRGADVAAGTRAKVKDNHGDWGLVPESLGLVVVQVPQRARLGTGKSELPSYTRWKQARPAGYSTRWAYGGSELLFYRADENAPMESVRDIDGLECRIWRERRLGMHSRDLYRLANAMERGGLQPRRLTWVGSRSSCGVSKDCSGRLVSG